jgi:hypothetical protein
MISEKHIERINKIIKDMVFEFEGNIFTPDVNIKFEYQFAITGQRKMISVGEYYDFLDVLVEIIDGDERATKIFHVFKALKNNLDKDYRLNNHLTYLIGEELSYFFGDEYVGIKIVKIQFSEEYDEKIKNINVDL